MCQYSLAKLHQLLYARFFVFPQYMFSLPTARLLNNFPAPSLPPIHPNLISQPIPFFCEQTARSAIRTASNRALSGDSSSRHASPPFPALVLSQGNAAVSFFHSPGVSWLRAFYDRQGRCHISSSSSTLDEDFNKSGRVAYGPFVMPGAV